MSNFLGSVQLWLLFVLKNKRKDNKNDKKNIKRNNKNGRGKGKKGKTDFRFAK